ncbi:MAG: hypothetical protein IPH83_17785 [Gammaproteobacteria bacterium]|nr:hypothetical protein [Gammaproteobacteria bacterium]
MPGREREYAELLMRTGIASFVLEYYLPRGMTSDFPPGCLERDRVRHRHRCLRGTELLSTSTRIDPRRIGVMGFSAGGMAARFRHRRAFSRGAGAGAAGFRAVCGLLRPCFQKLTPRVRERCRC